MVFDDCAGNNGDRKFAGDGLIGLEVGCCGLCLVDVLRGGGLEAV